MPDDTKRKSEKIRPGDFEESLRAVGALPDSPSSKPPAKGKQRVGRKTVVKRARAITDFSERLIAAEERRVGIETIRMARAIALAGLPKRPTNARDLVRTLRIGKELWLRVTYSTKANKRLPYGQDRFVLAGIQHLAIEQGSPAVLFERAGELLAMFGINQDGRSLHALRERFNRLAGLSIHLEFADTEEQLDRAPFGSQVFVIHTYKLPTRHELKADESGLVPLPKMFGIPELDDMPYGVLLSQDFWAMLQESKNRLIMPLDLLKLFIDRPTGWDYACFLVARCGSARTSSVVPHEAIISLFKDNPKDNDRRIIPRLKRYHEEIRLATGGRLNAEFFEDTPLRNPKGGRPKKRWSLRVAPSRSLIGKKVIAMPSSPEEKPEES